MFKRLLINKFRVKLVEICIIRFNCYTVFSIYNQDDVRHLKRRKKWGDLLHPQVKRLHSVLGHCSSVLYKHLHSAADAGSPTECSIMGEKTLRSLKTNPAVHTVATSTGRLPRSSSIATQTTRAGSPLLPSKHPHGSGTHGCLRLPAPEQHSPPQCPVR